MEKRRLEPLTRGQIRGLFMPGFYKFGMEYDEAACDLMIDAVHEAHNRDGWEAAVRVYKRLIDGYMICRRAP